MIQSLIRVVFDPQLNRFRHRKPSNSTQAWCLCVTDEGEPFQKCHCLCGCNRDLGQNYKRVTTHETDCGEE